MKALKFFIVLCIMLCFATFNVNAQEKKNGTVSDCISVPVVLELWCDGSFVGFINNVWADAHMRVHYNDGNKIWMKITVHSTFLFNGVNYEINGKTDIIDEDIQEAHYEIKGDDGSHYVGIVTVSDKTGEFTFSKALCPGN